MSRLMSATFFILLFLFKQPISWAQPYDQGLYWDVVSPKGQRSTLVGSVHVGDPAVQAKIDKALALVKSSSRVVLELDGKQMAKVVQMLQNPVGAPFSQDFPADVSLKVRQALASKGMSPDYIERLPAWMVVLALAKPEPAGAGTDLQLAHAAQQSKKPVLGLETAEEQVDVFRKLPIDLLQQLAAWLVDNEAAQQNELQAVLAAYAAEDLTKLLELGFEKSVPATLSAQQQALVLDQLINRRNERMLEAMQPYLKSGKSLIAVGALHLPGILEGLSDQGYTVQRLER